MPTVGRCTGSTGRQSWHGFGSVSDWRHSPVTVAIRVMTHDSPAAVRNGPLAGRGRVNGDGPGALRLATGADGPGTHLMGTDEIPTDKWPRELSIKLVAEPGIGTCLGLQNISETPAV